MLYEILNWILECPGRWQRRNEDRRMHLVYEQKHLCIFSWQTWSIANFVLPDTVLCFSDTELDMNGMASDHNTSSQQEYLPHYLQKEDPFASKLSKEADIIAGFYLTVIGNDFVIHLWNMTKPLHPCRHSKRRQKLLCIRCVITYFFILERKTQDWEKRIC